VRFKALIEPVEVVGFETLAGRVVAILTLDRGARLSERPALAGPELEIAVTH
jgi:hypothetical protein